MLGMTLKMSHFDFYIYPSWQIQMHQLIDRFIRRFHDIDKAFMRLDHEVFTAIAVDKRTSRHIIVFAICGKRYGTHDFGAGSHRRIQNLLTAIIDNPAVIRF